MEIDKLQEFAYDGKLRGIYSYSDKGRLFLAESSIAENNGKSGRVKCPSSICFQAAPKLICHMVPSVCTDLHSLLGLVLQMMQLYPDQP